MSSSYGHYPIKRGFRSISSRLKGIRSGSASKIITCLSASLLDTS